MMQDICGNATQTIIWLGYAEDNQTIMDGAIAALQRHYIQYSIAQGQTEIKHRTDAVKAQGSHLRVRPRSAVLSRPTIGSFTKIKNREVSLAWPSFESLAYNFHNRPTGKVPRREGCALGGSAVCSRAFPERPRDICHWAAYSRGRSLQKY